MLEVDNAVDLLHHVGSSIGVSEWIEVDQAMIDAFARTTGDDQWIHVDMVRAASAMPDGRTIAHGYLLLSLLPLLNRGIYRIRNKGRSLNYGLNKVRFMSPVQSGTRVRLDQRVKSVEAQKGGHLIGFLSTLEIEGSHRPALVAEPLTLILG